MGYRGEDSSRTRAESRHQSPWPSSSTEPGATGSWNDGPRGYGQDDDYTTADGYGGYPGDDSYAGYEQYDGGTGYGQPADHRQQAGYDGGVPNGYRDEYGPGDDYNPGPRHGEAPGYGQFDDYGSPRGDYPQGNGLTSGDGYPGGNGYGQGDGFFNDDRYAHRNGYSPGDGYPASDGYGDGYPGGYGDTHDDARYDQPRPGATAYDADYRTGEYGRSDGHPAQPGGYSQSGGYPAQPGGYSQSGGYPAQPGGYGQSGGYPAGSDGYGRSGDYPVQGTPPAERADVPGRYAGNDWYGGQPGAASGSGFADTGTYTMDARIIDSYGTGPRPADYGTGGYAPSGLEPNGYEQDNYHDGDQGGGSAQLAVRGFPPSAAPVPARLELPAPPGLVHTGQQERYEDVHTGQQERYEDQYESYPGYADQDEYSDRQGYDEPAGFGAQGYNPVPRNDIPDGYDDYADDGNPYQDRYGTDGAGDRFDGRSKAGGDSRDRIGGKRRKRLLLLSALAVVVVGVLGVAAYTFVFKPKPSAGGSPVTAAPLPTTGSATAATAACAKQFGSFCHIELRTDDPTPLTLTELFPPQFQNETDHNSFLRVVTRLDKTCANAVIGQDLISALQSGKCTQVLRASFVSGDHTIMGTIGVVNLNTTHVAHQAGKVVGANDFVAPLSSSKGLGSQLGKGTGVVEAEFKGHYLILTWAEFANTKAPTTKAQDQQLEQFETDLVAGTANIPLSQRMVNGAPATAAS